MTGATIAPETSALLDAIAPNGSGSSTHTDDLYSLVLPISKGLGPIQKRIIDLEALLQAAEGAETVDYAYAHFHPIRNKLGAIADQAKAMIKGLSWLADLSYQLDQLSLEVRAAIYDRDQRVSDEAERAKGFIVLSKAEHAHLLDRANAGTAAIKAAALETTVAQPLPLGDTA